MELFSQMNSSERKPTWVLGITGASGVRYALRLLTILPDLVHELHVVVSESALRVLSEEEGIRISGSAVSFAALTGNECANVQFYNPRDVGARIASGSLLTDGMIIVPCSMSTVGALSSGAHSHLVHRAADVTMKEGRRLIIVPRETPLSALHLENMYKLASMGVRVVPAMPGFYHRPLTIEELVDMMVMKILDQMSLPNNLVRRWQQGEK